MTQALILVLALLLDRIVGEPPILHPLVGFGELSRRVENFSRKLFADAKWPYSGKLRGAIAVILCIAPFTAAAAIIQDLPLIGPLSQVLLVYLAIGSKSLSEHALRVSSALAANNLNGARQEVSRIVSRDTAQLDEEGVTTAAIESVLENGNDAIFAPIFWYMLGGAPGIVLYRLANTLDAMWGYKNEKYLQFGWAAARLDDLLNLIPARLTALTYTILGKRVSAWQCWHQQGTLWYSPNAGPVMAAGAGALDVLLGGPAIYEGNLKQRPVLGTGNPPSVKDIALAVDLVQHGILVWAAFFVLEGCIRV